MPDLALNYDEYDLINYLQDKFFFFLMKIVPADVSGKREAEQFLHTAVHQR